MPRIVQETPATSLVRPESRSVQPTPTTHRIGKGKPPTPERETIRLTQETCRREIPPGIAVSRRMEARVQLPGICRRIVRTPEIPRTIGRPRATQTTIARPQRKGGQRGPRPEINLRHVPPRAIRPARDPLRRIYKTDSNPPTEVPWAERTTGRTAPLANAAAPAWAHLTNPSARGRGER